MTPDDRERLVRIEVSLSALGKNLDENVVKRLNSHSDRLARLERVAAAATTLLGTTGTGLYYFKDLIVEWVKRKVEHHA